MEQENSINHLAIVMDGNARWASLRGLPKSAGHKKGADNIKELLENAISLNIPNLTLYAFSYENWHRSEEEVSSLLNLLAYYLRKEVDGLNRNNIRIKFIGNMQCLDDALKNSISDAEELTYNNTRLTLYIAFSYGGRREIIDACNKIINSGIRNIDEDQFKDYLYDPKMPDVDLFIRPSGEYRISNFLLWQSAYAEFYFTSKLWPEFGKEDLMKAIEDYKKRKRRFGGR